MDSDYLFVDAKEEPPKITREKLADLGIAPDTHIPVGYRHMIFALNSGYKVITSMMA